jgi:hypothetical protein
MQPPEYASRLLMSSLFRYFIRVYSEFDTLILEVAYGKVSYPKQFKYFLISSENLFDDSKFFPVTVFRFDWINNRDIRPHTGRCTMPAVGVF